MRKPLLYSHFNETNHAQNTMIINKPDSVAGETTIPTRRMLIKGKNGEFIEIEEQGDVSRYYSIRTSKCILMNSSF
jgi:hypothetical protein